MTERNSFSGARLHKYGTQVPQMLPSLLTMAKRLPSGLWRESGVDQKRQNNQFDDADLLSFSRLWLLLVRKPPCFFNTKREVKAAICQSEGIWVSGCWTWNTMTHRKSIAWNVSRVPWHEFGGWERSRVIRLDPTRFYFHSGQYLLTWKMGRIMTDLNKCYFVFSGHKNQPLKCFV